MLPGMAEVAVTLASGLELALEQTFGAAVARPQVDRIHRILCELAARSVAEDTPFPAAVMFMRSQSPISFGEGTSTSGVMVVRSDDTSTVEKVSSITSLEEYAASVTLRVDDVYVAFVRTSTGQHFFVNGRRLTVASYYDPCLFFYGTHYDLAEALVSYGGVVVRRSECGHLEACWFDKDKRVLIPDPHAKMRESLYQYLRQRLSSHIVAKHAGPQPDITVDWKSSSRKGFVAIEWLGVSTQETRADFALVTQKAHSLRDDCVIPFSEDHTDVEVLGYLTIFDAHNDNLEISLSPDISEKLRVDYRWRMSPQK